MSIPSEVLHTFEKLASTEIHTHPGQANVLSVFGLVLYQLLTTVERLVLDALALLLWALLTLTALFKKDAVQPFERGDRPINTVAGHLQIATVVFIACCPVTIELALHKWG